MSNIAKYNRIKTKQARVGSNWCFGCDMHKVRDGEKCPVCGRLNNRKRFKKISDIGFLKSEDR